VADAFSDWCKRHEMDFASAQAYRQRHLVAALKAMGVRRVGP
jgi:hypothetical protein